MTINGHVITVIECLSFKEAWNVKNDWKNQKAHNIIPAKINKEM